MKAPRSSDAVEPRHLLRDLLDAALAAVHGRACVARALRAQPVAGPVRLVALGKAAQAMAVGAIDALGEAVQGGLVVSKAGHLDRAWLEAHRLTGLIGGHPLPSLGSLTAGEALRTTLAEDTGATWLVLLSGGTSSLIEWPIDGLGLQDLQRANDWLLGSGLPIASINRVRKALSRIKGGGLLRSVAGSRLRVLAISDVPGDDPAVIGSGLLVPEPRLAEDLARLELPGWLRAWVSRGLGQRGEAPSQGPAIELVATLDQAKQAAAEAARAQGWAVHGHPDFVAGEAENRGRELGIGLGTAPAGVHIWGGETTVQLPPRPGRGGRNQHLALAAACAMAAGDAWLMSVGTDGSDGPTDAAGALVDGETVVRATRAGLDANEGLRRADAGTVLAATGDLIYTGPTGTNVMDLILGLKPYNEIRAARSLPRPLGEGWGEGTIRGEATFHHPGWPALPHDR